MTKKNTIQNVTIYKQGGVHIRYTSGKGCDYSLNKMPETAMNFILREDVKAFENEAWVMYKVA